MTSVLLSDQKCSAVTLDSEQLLGKTTSMPTISSLAATYSHLVYAMLDFYIQSAGVPLICMASTVQE